MKNCVLGQIVCLSYICFCFLPVIKGEPSLHHHFFCITEKYPEYWEYSWAAVKDTKLLITEQHTFPVKSQNFNYSLFLWIPVLWNWVIFLYQIIKCMFHNISHEGICVAHLCFCFSRVVGMKNWFSGIQGGKHPAGNTKVKRKKGHKWQTNEKTK